MLRCLYPVAALCNCDVEDRWWASSFDHIRKMPAFQDAREVEATWRVERRVVYTGLDNLASGCSTWPPLHATCLSSHTVHASITFTLHCLVRLVKPGVHDACRLIAPIVSTPVLGSHEHCGVLKSRFLEPRAVALNDGGGQDWHHVLWELGNGTAQGVHWCNAVP
jgi:hypothetical protein